MANLQLLPYITFNNNCEEAMNFYQGIFGGELDIKKFGENYGELPAESRDKIMHAYLKNEMLSLMGSDPVPGDEVPVKFGDNVRLCVTGPASDEQKLAGFFEKLSDGAQILLPFEKQAWGQMLGMLTDKFGIGWLISTGE